MSIGTSSTPSKFISEDWAVVLLGFITISVTLSLFVFPAATFSWKNVDDLFTNVLAADNLLKIFWQLLFVSAIGAAAIAVTGKSFRSYLIVFPIVFVLTQIALTFAGNAAMKGLNLEAVIFSLAIGLIIGNGIALPEWFRQALTTELFVKIGLVLLGTSVLFSDILKAGGLGLTQALVVVISVWYFAFWISKKLKLDEEFSMMLSSAVSICGVSAAIATAGAIKGDTKKLSYVISLVLVTAIPMMIFMPYIARYLNLSQAETGAWLGGTIDTTGAVIAAGSLVGETALKISTIVKFSQNVLLGVAAFAISVYWTYVKKTETKEKPTLATIWERFPKFVLGFVAASILFSFFLSPEKISAVKDSLKSIQTLWFALAFTSIGLETKFSDLFNRESRRPLYAFLIAQLFNILFTLIIAYLLF